MAKFTIHEAKTHFSKLLLKAAEGEEVIIVNRDRPVAMLVPIEAKQRNWGFLTTEVRISKDFDDLPEGFKDYV